jgi:hypothetical protein
LHLLRVGDRDDARKHRHLAAERVELVDHAQVGAGLEEELRDAEVGHGELRREVAPVGGAVTVGAGVQLGVGGDPDAEVTDLADELDELGGVGELDRVVLPVGGGIPGEGEDVRDAGGLVLLEQGHELLAGVGDAGEVRHGGDARVLLDVHDDVARAHGWSRLL